MVVGGTHAARVGIDAGDGETDGERGRRFDLVVIGGGAAGLAAAVTAADAGLRVLLAEKAPAVGGTTAKSGGVYWVPGSHLQAARGIEDGVEHALPYMARVAAPERYDPAHPTLGLTEWEYDLIRAYPSLVSAAVEYFDATGALRSTIEKGLAFPDYHEDLEEHGGIRGRALCPMDASGDPATGQELIDQLHAASMQLGVEMLTGHVLTDLVVNGDAVGGVVLEDTATRRTLVVESRGGVVLATGGFTHNALRRERHLPARTWGGCASAGNTGDILEILERLDVPLHAMASAWWDQVAVEHTLHTTTETRAGMWVAPGDSSFIVDLDGRRVCNEKAVYNERAKLHLRGPGAPTLVVLVYDTRTAELFSDEAFAYPLPQPGESVDHVISGADWQALAQAIDERVRTIDDGHGELCLGDRFADNLASTAERFNASAREGVDRDFGRGEQPIELFFTGASRPGGGPNPTMAPLSDSGPYFAVLIGLGTLDTKGGPRTDCDARVLDAAGRPVLGLYAAGNCAASPTGHGYWAAGATIGPALAFGYAAARHVASRLTTGVSPGARGAQR